MNNYEDAVNFLNLLYPSESITFQTFPNSEDCNLKPEILHGTMEQHWDHLQRSNHQGAGIYTMVNAGDSLGRKNENVRAITSVFLDLDGSPLGPVQKSPIKPHVIIQTSPDRFQVRWKISPIPVNDNNRDSSSQLFRKVQRGVADKFGGDRHVSGLCGVARVPGFMNMKDSPFPVRILEINDLPEYPITALIDAFGIDLKNEYRRKTDFDPKSLNLNLTIIPDGTRNKTLFDTFRKIGSKGILGDDLLDIGMYINDEYCDPPKSDDHVRGIVCRVTDYNLRKSKRLLDHDGYVDLILQTQHLVHSGGYFFRFYTDAGGFRILDKRALVNRVFQASNKKALREDIDEVLQRIRAEISNRLPAQNPEVEFIRTMLKEGGEDERSPLKSIYDRYKLWCLNRNIKPLTMHCLSAEIELRTGKAPKTVRQKEHVFWGYVGLSLK